MHIPDGFLSPPVWATLDAIALPTAAWVARRAQRSFPEHQAPLLGVLGAFVFAAQMINFPVGVGTSGHLVGAALLTFTIGPAAASIVMTAILILQALVFQDGGILALGANVVNMAFAGVLAAHLACVVLPEGRRGLTYFAGGALSLAVSAVLALTELLISGVRMPLPVLGLSLALFGVSAIIEGAITVAVIQGLEALNPGFIRTAGPRRGTLLKAVLLFSFLLTTFGLFLASAQPDGIWSLAGRVGLRSHTYSNFSAPLADYKATLFGAQWPNHAVAGIAGLLMVYLLCLAIVRLIARRRLPSTRGV